MNCLNIWLEDAGPQMPVVACDDEFINVLTRYRKLILLSL